MILLDLYGIILPQISGYIRYFDNGGKSMSFMIKDDNVLVNYKEMWDEIKKLTGTKLHSKPIYDD